MVDERNFRTVDEGKNNRQKKKLSARVMVKMSRLNREALLGGKSDRRRLEVHWEV